MNSIPLHISLFQFSTESTHCCQSEVVHTAARLCVKYSMKGTSAWSAAFVCRLLFHVNKEPTVFAKQ